MKKFIYSLMGLAVVFSLVACGGTPPDLSDRIEDGKNDPPPATSYTGVIQASEIDLFKDGTHQIQTQDRLVVIQSPTINLNHYLNKEVVIFGSMQKLIDNKEEVFTVEKVELDGDETLDTTEYKNAALGLEFFYPSLWQLIEESNKVVLRGGGQDWVVVEPFTTRLDLDEFVADREVEDGTAVTIGGQRSLRYVEEAEIRVYTPNASGSKVFRIVFSDTEEGDEEAKDRFYRFLESFTPLGGKAQTGEKCGGEDNLTCPESFRCELSSAEAEAEGICVPIEEEGGDLNCPFVPTPSGCTNYEVKSTNRDNCPTSYVCLDDPAEELEAGEDQNSEEELEEEKGLSERVTEAFSERQDQILSEADELLQFEVMEAEELIAAIYLADEKKYRTVYRFEPSADEFNFIKQAHYEEGEERDWMLVEGETVSGSGGTTVIKPGNNGEAQVIRDDMRLYENGHKDFSMQYPKNWYFRSFGSIENTVWTVGFAEESLDHVSDSEITLEILDESSSGKKEMEGGSYRIEKYRDEDSHFLVVGPLEMKDDLEFMAESILQN